MTNLLIGLAVGIASAVPLVVMWRLAERLRARIQSGEFARRDRGRPPGRERQSVA